MHITRWAVVASGLVFVLAAAGCGSGGGGQHNGVASLSGHTATTRGRGGNKGDKKAFEDAMLDFSRCMREHGVDMPDPTFSDNGSGGGMVAKVVGGGPMSGGAKPDDKTMQAAQAACQPIMDRAEQNAPRPSP